MKRYRRDSWMSIVYETSRYVERGSCLSGTQRRQELMWLFFDETEGEATAAALILKN